MALFNTTLRHYFINVFGKNNNLLDFIGWIFVDRSNSYCNPIVIIQTICYFLIFKNIKTIYNTDDYNIHYSINVTDNDLLYRKVLGRDGGRIGRGLDFLHDNISFSLPLEIEEKRYNG